MVRKVVGAALGQCIHIAGLEHFLAACESHGWKAVRLGPAVPSAVVLAAIEEEHPDMVAVSYRLTPDDAVHLFSQLREGLRSLLAPRAKWVFGGTPPVAKLARESGLFDAVFDGSEGSGAVEAYLHGETVRGGRKEEAQTLLSRIQSKSPVPLLRHHYGEPDLRRTIRGVKRIALSGVLDVLSIGPDQNAQEHFFHPERMDPLQHGAGGVPLRRPADLEAIYAASRSGNYPLVRCYSGTRDLIAWAEMSLSTINIAWGAIPLTWYSVMDGRSTQALPEAIREKQAAMRFYAERGTPVEVNESHQWSLRDAHDSLAVASAFLAAYNAKKQGVQHYIIQMMLNTPPKTSPSMDLAKMLAKLELISTLESRDFQTFREARAGITSLPLNQDEAKGHMAASTVYAMALKPHILHVVGYSEAHRVVDPRTLIESCRIARGAVNLALLGTPDMVCDRRVQKRKRHLVKEARVLLGYLANMKSATNDPWSDPDTLAEAIRTGVLDTPHFRSHPYLCGLVSTACIDGGWEALHPVLRTPISEEERLNMLSKKTGA